MFEIKVLQHCFIFEKDVPLKLKVVALWYPRARRRRIKSCSVCPDIARNPESQGNNVAKIVQISD